MKLFLILLLISLGPIVLAHALEAYAQRKRDHQEPNV